MSTVLFLIALSGSAVAATPGDTSQVETARIHAALLPVKDPSPSALARALKVEIANTQEEFADSAGNSLVQLRDLEGSGASDLALKWVRSPGSPPGSNPGSDLPSIAQWAVYFLAWDGTQWIPSLMKEGVEPFELQVLGPPARRDPQLALVVYSGSAEVPYPAIYQVRNHAANLLWDGRADGSQYEGMAMGRIEFRASQGPIPEMIETGRADPGLIHFPKQGRRGFDARSTYRWDGRSYVLEQTEYSANQDFALYQFIAALHLKDFRAAYALIDPGKFLNTASPSLKLFQQHIENDLPEFLDDEIFDALDASSGVSSDFSFQVEHEGRTFTYTPQFSTGPNYRIAGLARQEAAIKKD